MTGIYSTKTGAFIMFAIWLVGDSIVKKKPAGIFINNELMIPEFVLSSWSSL